MPLILFCIRFLPGARSGIATSMVLRLGDGREATIGTPATAEGVGQGSDRE
jgi:hypothetical protein